MPDDFYCFHCGKRRPIESRSDKKIGRYKKSYQCKTCYAKAMINTDESNKDPEQLIGYKSFKVKHLRAGANNYSKKQYSTDKFYKYLKKQNII